MKVAVTGTAALLYALVDTSSGVASSANYYNTAPPLGSDGGTLTEPRDSVNVVSLRCEDGDIRYAIGAVPTALLGTLVRSGTRMFVHGDISKLQLIRTGAANVAVEVGFYSAMRGESGGANTDSVSIAVEPTIDIGNIQELAASTTTAGTVAATNGAGGTTIIAANALRNYAQCQNNGGVDVYFGAGVVTSSFPKVVPNGIFTWDSQEALKVLSSGANCNIAYIDYSNS